MKRRDEVDTLFDRAEAGDSKALVDLWTLALARSESVIRSLYDWTLDNVGTQVIEESELELDRLVRKLTQPPPPPEVDPDLLDTARELPHFYRG